MIFFLVFQESGLVALLQVNNLKGFLDTDWEAQNLERSCPLVWACLFRLLVPCGILELSDVSIIQYRISSAFLSFSLSAWPNFPVLGQVSSRLDTL